jgi:hypothetical protein
MGKCRRCGGSFSTSVAKCVKNGTCIQIPHDGSKEKKDGIKYVRTYTYETSCPLEMQTLSGLNVTAWSA